MSFKKGPGFIRDRFTQGLVAGIIGWVPYVTFILIMFGLHLTKFRYMDFAAILAWGQRPNGFCQSVFAECIIGALVATLGGIFALFLKVISDRNIRIKGAIYGGAAWFILYSVTNLFKLEKIYGEVDFATAVSDMAGAIIYGVVMAWALWILNRRYGMEN
jgi:hypothetical protein